MFEIGNYVKLRSRSYGDKIGIIKERYAINLYDDTNPCWRVETEDNSNPCWLETDIELVQTQLRLGDKVKLLHSSSHFGAMTLGKVVDFHNIDFTRVAIVQSEASPHLGSYNTNELILIPSDRTEMSLAENSMPSIKMNGKKYQAIARVGDIVRIKTSETIMDDYDDGLEGYVGEISGEGFYLWQNHENGTKGKIMPKGYEYSWLAYFDVNTEIEIVTKNNATTKVDKTKPTKIRKAYITLEKGEGKMVLNLKIMPELEEFFKKSSGGKLNTSAKWFNADGKPVEFYAQDVELERQLIRLDSYAFSDFGSGLIRDGKINIAVLRTVDASKRVKISAESFDAISNADLEDYSTKLGRYIKKLWESAISKSKIKSVITYEI